MAAAIVMAFAPHAAAHAPTFAVYSKYEATVSGRRIAFVFALDRPSVLQLIQRDVTHAPVDVATVSQHRAFFSQFLFARFSVSNDGAPCAHPPELGRFFWDEPTKRVVAVTSFVCPGVLNQLTIRSTVTHDMPTAHELVGDLLYDGAQARSTFANDDVEAHLSLPALAAAGGDSAVAPRRRGKFSFVGVPDRERRYDDLARAELGGDALMAPHVSAGRLESVLYFIGQGILHIFTGYDHVLFIVTLMLVVASWRRLAVIVTSFTLAHSLTLAVGALGWVVLPSRIIEPAIALTVLAVAADALARPRGSARAWVTFGFGLIHGFGLSSALRTIGLSGGALLRALFGFNIGVELGQLLIVLPLFPLVLRLRAHEALYARVRRAVCVVVAAVAMVWFIVRVAGRGASG
ncbi:MAG TPA: HupE/UreJ family protein [Polyangia bacterium]|nr:HupE/UreJ family protein [Polyangia bacterium]